MDARSIAASAPMTPPDREITLTRVFDAPRDMIFDAWTKPELAKRWLGVRAGWPLAVCDIDLRVGGLYRLVWRGPDGLEIGLCGLYREIARPGRLVAIEWFDPPWYPGDAVVTKVFTDRGGRTVLNTTIRYETREVRDAMLRTSMMQEVSESYDRLTEILVSVA